MEFAHHQLFIQFLNLHVGLRLIEVLILVLILLLIAIFSYLTNPFVRFSLVADFSSIVVEENGDLGLESEREVIVRKNRLFKNLASIKSGWHMLSSRFAGGPKSSSKIVDDVIASIHKLRFNPSNQFLISGDHFSVLYLRSLGIFYHSILDSRTALDEEDWFNRQALYLKTTGYALKVFSSSDRLSTTIVPIGRSSVALVNIYAYPSDTLYSLLYALSVMQDDQIIRKLYPFGEMHEPKLELNTKDAARLLTAQYKENLQFHLKTYIDTVFDKKIGLIKKNVLLSGAKDITRRQGAFYDNVIFWRTTQLAQELGLVKKDATFLADLKKKILKTYWLETEGYFLEDLSAEALENKFYSSDWLIVLMTGFLDLADVVERDYFERSIAYIQRNAIDQPFGLQYHPDLRRHRQYLVTRIAAPSYGSTAIWSNWGMEYIKALAILNQTTQQSDYLHRAKDQTAAYSFNIKRYRGYPEVYDAQGDFYRQVLYKSIRQTGWVVSFEQARAMVDWTAEQRAADGRLPTSHGAASPTS